MQSQYVKRKNFIVNVVYGILIILIVYVALKYALGLVSPFLFAFVIAYLLKTPTRYLSSKLKLPYKPIALILVLLFYCTIGVLISLLGVKLVSSVTSVISQIPVIYETQLEPFLNSTFNGIEQALFRMDPALVGALNEGFDQFVELLGNNVTNISLTIVGTLSNFTLSLPGFLIKVLLMIISTFFIALDYDALSRFVLRQFSDKGREVILSIKRYIVGTLFVVIRSYALIMSITFVELSIGLTVIGIPNAVLVALLISVFDILPVLGTGGIMIPWTIVTLFQGNYQTALSLLVVYVIVLVVRNILEPKIVGSQLGLHPVVTLMCIFIGANLFGVIGLFGFPIALSLLRHLNDAGTIKLFK